MARSEQEIEKLLEQMEELKAQLAIEKTARTAAESMAHALAEFGSNNEEHATGKTLRVKACANPTERDVKKQIWKEIEFPLYAYKIDVPPAFNPLSTNGREYYIGGTYEFTEHGLADIKARVAQCWQHEKNIHGDNPNAYRRQRKDRA